MTSVSEVVALEFEAPTGERLRFEWPAERLAALDGGAPTPSRRGRLAGELDWDEIEAVRVLSGRLDDGRLLAVAALRPAGADGHGDELVAGALGEAERFEQIARDAALDRVRARRAAAADRPRALPRGEARSRSGSPARPPTNVAFEERGVLRDAATLALRSAGAGGAAVFDVLRAREELADSRP